MSKRTVGKRIAFAQEFYQLGLRQSENLKRRIDAAIRREKAKSWDECAAFLHASGAILPVAARSVQYGNPYRGRAKR